MSLFCKKVSFYSIFGWWWIFIFLECEKCTRAQKRLKNTALYHKITNSSNCISDISVALIRLILQALLRETASQLPHFCALLTGRGSHKASSCRTLLKLKLNILFPRVQSFWTVTNCWLYTWILGWGGISCSWKRSWNVGVGMTSSCKMVQSMNTKITKRYTVTLRLVSAAL